MPETPHASPPGATGLLARYTPAGNSFDELLATPGGDPRPHWQPLLEALDRLGPDELAARWESGRRIIGEHGITYNIHGDPQGLDRPWELDVIPLVLPGEEWRRIEAGLTQRARLFNLILNDLYAGPQRLIRDGFIPPSLVYANPGFLRPCHGIRPPAGLFIHLHAVDLARTPDGQWRVLADRTQAPAGPGYALENRMVLSRILPDEFRTSRVEPIAPFVAFLRQSFRSTKPTSNTPTSPATSVSPSSKVTISPPATAASSSRLSRACSPSTSSSAGSTNATPTRSSCAKIRSSASRAWSRPPGPGT
jgi:uncharacterized circularly permuted ATP-grasp superfamily protein